MNLVLNVILPKGERLLGKGRRECGTDSGSLGKALEAMGLCAQVEGPVVLRNEKEGPEVELSYK